MQFLTRRDLAAAGTALALAGFSSLPAMAQDRPTVPRIMVTGEGEASIRPDMAILSLTVMREADTAAEALRQNNEAMTAVTAAMKEASIEARDLQTGSLQISPQYNYPSSSNPGQSPKVSSYQVMNTLVVRVRNLDALGGLIDRAVELGVNQGAGITFTNDDPSSAITQARRQAVADAIDRAKTLAEASGTQIGNILEISEQAQHARPMPIEARVFRAQPAGDGVPLEFGENTYRVNVDVTFQLK